MGFLLETLDFTVLAFAEVCADFFFIGVALFALAFVEFAFADLSFFALRAAGFLFFDLNFIDFDFAFVDFAFLAICVSHPFYVAQPIDDRGVK